jgi:hypothetical protein
MTKTTVPGSRSNSSEDVGVVARAATAPEEGVTDPGRRIVYNGLMLFDLTITFQVVIFFTDKPNGSNFIEHQLSVVKR